MRHQGTFERSNEPFWDQALSLQFNLSGARAKDEKKNQNSTGHQRVRRVRFSRTEQTTTTTARPGSRSLGPGRPTAMQVNSLPRPDVAYIVLCFISTVYKNKGGQVDGDRGPREE